VPILPVLLIERNGPFLFPTLRKPDRMFVVCWSRPRARLMGRRKSTSVVNSVRVAKKVRHMTELFIGLDVHKDTIAVAIAEEGRSGDVRNLGIIEHTPGQITQLMKRLERKRTSLHFCYEAGPCGYVLHRQILDRGHNCMVVAPSTMPVKPGARIKTDRRDATNLARLLRAGELEGVWVPDPAHEAIRDLIRTRADAVDAVKRSKQQLIAFLLRHGRTFDGPGKWTRSHYTWLSEQKFEHPAHQIVCQDYINAIHDGQQRSRELEKMLVELIPTWSMEPVADALCSIRGISVVAATTSSPQPAICVGFRRRQSSAPTSASFQPSTRAARASTAWGSQSEAIPKCGASSLNARGHIAFQRASPRTLKSAILMRTRRCASWPGALKSGFAAGIAGSWPEVNVHKSFAWQSPES
jgi:transposase